MMLQFGLNSFHFVYMYLNKKKIISRYQMYYMYILNKMLKVFHPYSENIWIILCCVHSQIYSVHLVGIWVVCLVVFKHGGFHVPPRGLGRRDPGHYLPSIGRIVETGLPQLGLEAHPWICGDLKHHQITRNTYWGQSELVYLCTVDS